METGPQACGAMRVAPRARVFASLAAGSDIKLSPTPFVATTRPEQLAPLRLTAQPLPPDHLVLVLLGAAGEVRRASAAWPRA